MALADPTSLAGYGATAVTGFTGATTLTVARQVEGRYIATNVGTTDEPVMLYVNADFRPQAISTFNFKLTRNKNVVINSVPQADDILVTSLQVKVPHRSFTSTEAQGLAMGLMSLAANASVWLQLMRGEK